MSEKDMMVMNNYVNEFEEYSTKIGNRVDLYRTVALKYGIKKAIYPGSHIDIFPSFVIPKVTYIDNFKGAIKFFKNQDKIQQYITSKKEYKDEPIIKFFGHNYEDDINIEKVDMIISLYADFVGQATKKHLKPGGILLCNDSHGDATLAYVDQDYEFIGIVNNRNQVKTNTLDKYFNFARPREIDVDKVLRTMKGPKYKLEPQCYLFRLKNS